MSIIGTENDTVMMK